MASSALSNWGEIIRTQNLSADKEMDPVSRWLLITRASVFPMTIISGLIGGLLAARTPGADAFLFSLAMVGLVAAHAANNMINDYFDLEGGVDSQDYVRAQYAPHPVLSGLISKKGLLLAIALVNLVDLVILLVLADARGPALVVFALLGLFVSVFYVAPPLKLKHHGLGEPGVFVVWGPLMIGGTYYATAGTVAPWVLLASIPYALLVTCVLMGKHVDKIEADTAKGIHTLPVILGRDRARGGVVGATDHERTPDHEHARLAEPVVLELDRRRHVEDRDEQAEQREHRERPAARVGEHTESVLRDTLALVDAELAALRRVGVISP